MGQALWCRLGRGFDLLLISGLVIGAGGKESVNIDNIF
jgi:hypothetical protein